LEKYDLQESYNNFKIKFIVSLCESGPWAGIGKIWYTIRQGNKCVYISLYIKALSFHNHCTSTIPFVLTTQFAHCTPQTNISYKFHILAP